MSAIRLSATAGPDGVLHLTIPVGTAGEYEVQVTPKPTPEELGWPPGYFERTFGALPNFTIEPRDQGEHQEREGL